VPDGLVILPTYDRQTRIFDPETSQTHVAIIGLGNIGSNAGILLARLGIKEVTLYDHDTIEAHNLASQHFSTGDHGALKTDALVRQMLEINPAMTIHAHAVEYTGENLGADMLIMAVDSMAIRQTILAGMIASGYDPYIIDGRSGGGQVEVHSQQFSAWGDTLYEGADTDPCGARFICYASAIVAGFITNTVKRVILQQPIKSRVIYHCDTNQIISY